MIGFAALLRDLDASMARSVHTFFLVEHSREGRISETRATWSGLITVERLSRKPGFNLACARSSSRHPRVLSACRQISSIPQSPSPGKIGGVSGRYPIRFLTSSGCSRTSKPATVAVPAEGGRKHFRCALSSFFRHHSDPGNRRSGLSPLQKKSDQRRRCAHTS